MRDGAFRANSCRSVDHQKQLKSWRSRRGPARCRGLGSTASCANSQRGGTWCPYRRGRGAPQGGGVVGDGKSVGVPPSASLVQNIALDGGHQGGEAVEQLQRRQEQRAVAARTGFGASQSKRRDPSSRSLSKVKGGAERSIAAGARFRRGRRLRCAPSRPSKSHRHAPIVPSPARHRPQADRAARSCVARARHRARRWRGRQRRPRRWCRTRRR